MAKGMEVSVVLPCLNEEKTIGICIKKAFQVFRENRISGEVIVVDNGSADSSAKIAHSLGAKVVFEQKKGYGSAYLRGFSESDGEVIVMADADDTYDLLEMPKLIDALKNNDFVLGSRLAGDIKKGAMPPLHRYIGNPMLSALLSTFFRKKISDAHSGFRAFRRDILERLNLKTAGMEFASEMLIKAIKSRLRIKEIPISYYPRKGKSKLSSFHDGWRHLRFMLLYSPLYLFIFPGFLIFLIGMILMLMLLGGPLTINNFNIDIHPMILGSGLVIVGFQIITLGIFAKIYSIKSGLQGPSRFTKLLEKHISFEKGAIVGGIIALAGIALGACIVAEWISSGFKGLSEMRTAIFAMTLVIVGMQAAFSAFFLSVLGIEKK